MITEKVDDLGRFREVVEILLKEEMGYLLERTGIVNHLSLGKRLKSRHQSRPGPVRVRETLEKLGTTYIKFGQMLANRPDLVPEEYVLELEKLEFDVKPFPWEDAREIVEEEVGLESFQEFEEEPLAAASIAQVHEARLESGEEVVVKVRRPGIVEEVESDLDILEFAAFEASRHVERARKLRVEKMVEEFASWTRDEMDLRKELENARLFEDSIPDGEDARVPEYHEELCTEKVLVMEKIDGTKLTDTEGLQESDLDVDSLAEKLLRIPVLQAVQNGVYHGDPHVSNFFIEDDGTVVYIDFGILGTLTTREQRLAGVMILNIMREDPEGAAQGYRDLCTEAEDADFEALVKLFDRKIMEIKREGLNSGAISRKLVEIAVTSSKHGYRPPHSVVMMGKDIATAEGIAVRIGTGADLNDTLENTVEKALKEKNDPKDLARDFAIDLSQNRELLTKLPSKLNEALERDHQTQVKVENQAPRPRGLTSISIAALGIAAAAVSNTAWPMAVAAAIIIYLAR